MNSRSILLCIFIASFLIHNSAVSAKEPVVIINEIAWMGTKDSANSEWIELKNETPEDIDLSGWTITSPQSKFKITLKGIILKHSFYLLERSSDKSLPEIKANLIYKGALNNTGVDLELYNNSHILVDKTSSSSNWSAGSNTTKQTAERTDSGAWQTSEKPGGTPKAQNSSGEKKINTPKEKFLTEPKKTDIKNNELLVAAISPSNNIAPPFIFLISLLLVVVSGGIILFLKFKK